MELILSDPNYEKGFRYFVKELTNQEYDCLLWIEENYIHQTNHDGNFG